VCSATAAGRVEYTGDGVMVNLRRPSRVGDQPFVHVLRLAIQEDAEPVGGRVQRREGGARGLRVGALNSCRVIAGEIVRVPSLQSHREQVGFPTVNRWRPRRVMLSESNRAAGRHTVMR